MNPQKVTLELPWEVAENARALAALAKRPLEEVLVQCLAHAVQEPSPLEAMSDEVILALCREELADQYQHELSELLARSREGSLESSDRERLEELLRLYRRGLRRKANAWSIAVARGLQPSLG